MSWPTIKTINLGTSIKDADGFRKAIRCVGMKMGSWASDIIGMPAFEVAGKEIEVDLVVKSVAELGFKDGARREEIWEVAGKLGLAKCPAEVGPQLRIQYADQPKGEWLVVYMDPVIDSKGNPRMFHVGHNERGQWLVGDLGDLDHIWGGHNQFIFVLPRK